MILKYLPTKEYVVEGEIIVIDPSYVFDKNTWDLLDDYLDITEGGFSKSGILTIDNLELFICKWEEGVFSVTSDEFVDDVSVDSGVLALMSRDTLKELNGDIGLGVLVDLNQKGEVLYIRPNKIDGDVVVSETSEVSYLDEEDYED